MLASIVIRTFNEQRHLDAVLRAVAAQDVPAHEREVVLVDSGSTDDTLRIAQAHGCRIVHIAKQDFTFGRSLNMGCAAAQGRQLVFLSGHCIPVGKNWLSALVAPLEEGKVAYSYGRQLGGEGTKFSESQIFRKYFPAASAVPQAGFFCNNANAALPAAEWQALHFDETLSGLEDMAMARKLVESGKAIGYVAEAAVHHLHDESWRSVGNRFEREAIALQSIMPQVHLSLGDFFRYWASACFMDLGAAMQERRALRCAWQIVAYRFMQFRGSYRGNHEHRKLSQAMKERYFYPR